MPPECSDQAWTASSGNESAPVQGMQQRVPRRCAMRRGRPKRQVAERRLDHRRFLMKAKRYMARQPNTALDGGTPDVVYFGVPLHWPVSRREPSRIPSPTSELLSDFVWPPPRTALT